MVDKLPSHKALFTKILKYYEESPCIWHPSNRFYFDRNVKEECYANMLKIYKTVYPSATVSTLKIKLSHFRAAYRRERKKVIKNHLQGVKYEPCLWYYKHMTFLDKKTPNADENNENDNDSSGDDEDVNEDSQDCVHIPSEKDTDIDEETSEEVKGTEQTDSATLFGLCIAKQLRELDDQVRYEAERIISDVIYRARTGKLQNFASEVNNLQNSGPAVDNGAAEASDGLFIPQTEPSWYDMPNDNSADSGSVVLRIENIKSESDAAAMQTDPLE